MIKRAVVKLAPAHWTTSLDFSGSMYTRTHSARNKVGRLCMWERGVGWMGGQNGEERDVWPLVPGVQSCGEKPVSKMGHIPEVTRYQVIME